MGSIWKIGSNAILELGKIYCEIMLRLFISVMILLATVACGSRATSTVGVVAASSEEALFSPSMPPASLTPEPRIAYMPDHPSDHLDFSDTVWIVSTDTTHMLRAFHEYVRTFVTPADPSPLVVLMQKASQSKVALTYFAMLAERVLHDPSSPVYSDELYIPVLNALIESPLLDEWEKTVPRHDLQLAMQNRVGTPANDFRYTLATGRTGTLYGIRAEYTLVFFNNPDCAMCKTLIRQMTDSPVLSELIGQGRLKILALYPDEDLTAWRAHIPDIPSTWINGYDAGTQISRNNLYDLRAIPSLYLLDRNKRVLLKDVYDVGYVEWVLSNNSVK